MSTTIKDIALKAGVSHMTVSRSLNNSPLVSQKTKEKVLEIAKGLNYSPNLSARSLVLNRSFNIGLFFSSIDKGTSPEYFYEVSTIVNNLIKDNYNLVVKSINDLIQFNNINRKHFDGIIILSQRFSDNKFIEDVVRKSIPTVCLNRRIEFAPCVFSDDVLGAQLCIEHLMERGCKRITLIEGVDGSVSSYNRRKGALIGAKNTNIIIDDDYKIGEYSHKGGYNAMLKMIKNKNLPDGVFCYNDDMAIGAMRALYENKISVPNDIKIIGYDGSISAKYTYPSLTTVRRPIRKISTAGTTMLLDLIAGKKHTEKIEVKPELIIREST